MTSDPTTSTASRRQGMRSSGSHRAMGLRPAARAVRGAGRQLTRSWRRLPDFVIIGAQKSGTTSLYDHLVDHPDVVPAVTKEVHFFDEHYDRGLDWYRGHFPIRRPGATDLTGEASPSYLVHPATPPRLAAALPDVRLIAVLRDPVDRAWSQYQHEVARGHETLGFEQALDAEEARLRTAPDRGGPASQTLSYELKHHGYLARGRYAEQLQAWLEHVPRDRLLVLQAERLYRRPAETMDQVHEFLGLPPHHAVAYVPRNQRSYGSMPPAVRARLRAYYAPHDERLFELLGVRWSWGAAPDH